MGTARPLPAILKHEKHGEEARKLFADAQKSAQRNRREKLIEPRAVYGFFPANRVGDDVELYTDESRTKVLTTFHFLRQQMEKTDGTPNWCLADFIAPKSIGLAGLHRRLRRHQRARPGGTGRKSSKPITTTTTRSWPKRWPTGLAEAFAEYLHKRVREEWGYGKDEKLSTEELIEEKYRGIRPAAGYPALSRSHGKANPLGTARRGEERRASS